MPAKSPLWTWQKARHKPSAYLPLSSPSHRADRETRPRLECQRRKQREEQRSRQRYREPFQARTDSVETSVASRTSSLYVLLVPNSSFTSGGLVQPRQLVKENFGTREPWELRTV